MSDIIEEFLAEFFANGVRMAQDEDGFVTLTDKEGNSYVAQMGKAEKQRYAESGKKLSQVKKEKKESEKKADTTKKKEKQEKTPAADYLVSHGGKMWNDRRVYTKDVAKEWLKVDADYYNSGNLRSFKWTKGEESNSFGRKVLSALDGSYFDIASKTFKVQVYGDPDTAEEIAKMLTQEAKDRGLDVNDPVKPEPKKEPESLKNDYGTETDRIRDLVKTIDEKDIKKAEESDFVKNYPYGEALTEMLKDQKNREKLAAIINNTKFSNSDEFKSYLKKYHLGMYEDLHNTQERVISKRVDDRIKAEEEQQKKNASLGKTDSITEIKKHLGNWNYKIYKYRDGTRAIFSNNRKIILNDEQYKFLKDKVID